MDNRNKCLVIFLLPILHVNAIQTLESSSVHDVASVDLTNSVIAQEEGSQDEIQEVETLQESVEEAETLQEALEIIEDELTISEQQYEQAYLAFQNGDFRQSEESLKLIVSTLVSPDFQKLFEEQPQANAQKLVRWDISNSRFAGNRRPCQRLATICQCDARNPRHDRARGKAISAGLGAAGRDESHD